MQEQEYDPYEIGREAMDALFETIEGEVIASAKVTKKGSQYHKVELLLSEYPIQEVTVNPRWVKIDGEMVGMSDVEDMTQRFWENIKVADVHKLPGTEGHNLQINFETVAGTEGPI